MSNLLVFAAHNAVATLVFAVFVCGLTRIWRNPQVAHVLWLVVLLKLVTPPVMRVDLSAIRQPGSTPQRGQIMADVSRIQGQMLESPTRFFARPTFRTTWEAWATSVKEHDFAASMQLFWNRGQPVLLWVWLGGACLCALFAATRIVCFERLLRDTLPASERLQRLAFEIAGKLCVRRVPDVRYVECVEVPLLWCAGRRPTIVLPMRLLGQFDNESLGLILAHELAHLRRRDHWVRAVELIVSTVYWWNPLVWVIRRQVHQSEELCCDAWVGWAFPDDTKRYAEVLLKTAESLNASQVGAWLLPASPFLRSLSLKARIEMILERRFAPGLSARSMFFMGLLAFLVLAPFVQTTRTEARAGSSDGAPPPARKPDAPTTSGFPYVVRFEQGATRFLNGDTITILEVQGTADTFTPGNIYLIKGAYSLASHDRAMLAAFVTAKDAENGTGAYLKVQATVVDRGNGTFTLFLPMSCRGWPHVSFYPADGGGVLGGNYFGTGDSVLKQWWGSKEKDRKATIAPAGSSYEGPSTPARNSDVSTTSSFPYAVRFEQGATRFLNGDTITILEVRGTADTLTPGNTYLIKGAYTLASHDRAMLAAYTTAMDPENGKGAYLKSQTTVVNQGSGTFTLVLPMSCRGWPHVSFYPADGGGDFGGSYFGTGGFVLKRWWGSKETD
jgi:beta-lactamase regulating signal transducer with metallopeptidase domain